MAMPFIMHSCVTVTRRRAWIDVADEKTFCCVTVITVLDDVISTLTMSPFLSFLSRGCRGRPGGH